MSKLSQPPTLHFSICSQILIYGMATNYNLFHICIFLLFTNHSENIVNIYLHTSNVNASIIGKQKKMKYKQMLYERLL